MDPRFGRAGFFLIVDPETMEFEVVNNEQNLNSPQGAGIQAGKIMVDNKVDAVITGNCGPKAFQVLSQNGIAILLCKNGRVDEAIAKYKAGELESSSSHNVDGHWV